MATGRLCSLGNDEPKETDLSQELVDRLRAGDAAALDEVIALHGREVKAVAYTILRNEADADEVAEDTFVTAWLKIGSLRDARALRSWLLKVASRLALRLATRQQAVPLGSADPLGASPDQSTAIIDRIALDAALRALPPGMRAVIALHYVADLSVDQVAKTLGRSRNTVKSQLRHALHNMRDSLALDQTTTRTAEVVR